MKKIRAKKFTLIELLVVIAIISILMGMMMPAIGKVKSMAHSAACKDNLRQLGIAFQSYMIDYKDNLPYISAMPSLKLNDFPRLCDIMAPYVGGSATSKVFCCPADRGPASPGVVTDSTDEDGNTTTSTSSAGSTGSSDFANEGASYEFNEFLYGRRVTVKTRVMLLHDYRPYHGKAGTAGAANYLFADGHVGDF
jgi:prepilin-type N-terminal cleavage/methylation domain-containing protein/prepilin-type processing-associated H-X9-DG protein